MIDWKRKLTSRKFWAAVAGFVSGMIVFFKSPTSDAQAVTALIMSFGSVVAYIIGEGLADAAGAGIPVIALEDDADKPENEADN